MISRKINRVRAEGDNIFVFQYIDGGGNATEERKSLEQFLKPFLEPFQSQIDLLEKSLQDKVKIEGLLDKEVLQLSEKISLLEKDKADRKDQIGDMLQDLEGKDLGESSSLYQEAFSLFSTGDIDEALEVLNEASLEEEEQKALEALKQKAETRLLKAKMLRMKHNYEEAGKNYEKALQLYADWGTCLEAANYFQFINDFPKAEKYYNQCLSFGLEGYEKATTLNNLAVLQSDKNEYVKAEQSYEEALAIYRKLAEVNPQTYLPDVGMTLNNLAVLQSDKNEYVKAEQSYEEALAIYRKLAEVNPQTYLPYVATTLNNLAVLQSDKNEYVKAEQSYEEALAIRRKLAEVNPQTYLPYVATTLNNLAVLQSDKNEYVKAEQSYEEALAIRRKLAEVNPQTYLPYVATTLNNLAVLQSDKNEYVKAEQSYEEALAIYRKLAKLMPSAFEIPLADSCLCLSTLYCYNLENRELSLSYAKEAIALYEKYADRVPYAKKWMQVARENVEYWEKK